MRISIDRSQVLLYGVAPLTVVSILIAMYFSGVPWMHRFAAPPHQREYGAVENVQNLILLAIIVLTVFRSRRETDRRYRLAWLGIAFFGFLVLMEELDWGYHYYRTLTDQPHRAEDRFNVHNKGTATYWIKFVVDTGLIVWFGVMPVLVRFLPRTLRRIRPYIPSPYSILTLLVMVVTGTVAHHLDDQSPTPPGSLHNNISEFREITTYWLAFLYLRTVPGNPAAK
ncbi:MAG: hypothetical protein ACYTGZ_19850 [Planctomycetota bacterium]|jgi:hypothetical protein